MSKNLKNLFCVTGILVSALLLSNPVAAQSRGGGKHGGSHGGDSRSVHGGGSRDGSRGGDSRGVHGGGSRDGSRGGDSRGVHGGGSRGVHGDGSRDGSHGSSSHRSNRQGGSRDGSHGSSSHQSNWQGGSRDGSHGSSSHRSNWQGGSQSGSRGYGGHGSFHGGGYGFGGYGSLPGGYQSSRHHYYPYHRGGPGAYHARYGHWYHGNWHDHWARPWHYGPTGWVGFGIGVSYGVGVSVGVWDAPWRWGYWPYYNPYYTKVIVVQNTPIDYSRPIVAAAPSAQLNVESESLDAARNAFARGDYSSALSRINEAIAQRPNDPLLHEFRALVFFATQEYKPAAEAIYAVLSVGPGWDWATLIGMYSDPEVYTSQLRALEQYRKAHPNSPEIRFLLAYHYMSCGHKDAAVGELKEVVRLNPKNQLAAQLLAGLTGEKPAAMPPTVAPPAPAKPVDAASLIGNWQASRPDGASFSLDLTEAKTFAWKYTQNGKTQEFAGDYTVADNLLILKQDGNATMIGQVVMSTPDQFQFKLAGNNPSDPGLTFTKK